MFKNFHISLISKHKKMLIHFWVPFQKLLYLRSDCLDWVKNLRLNLKHPNLQRNASEGRQASFASQPGWNCIHQGGSQAPGEAVNKLTLEALARKEFHNVPEELKVLEATQEVQLLHEGRCECQPQQRGTPTECRWPEAPEKHQEQDSGQRPPHQDLEGASCGCAWIRRRRKAWPGLTAPWAWAELGFRQCAGRDLGKKLGDQRECFQQV